MKLKLVKFLFNLRHLIIVFLTFGCAISFGLLQFSNDPFNMFGVVDPGKSTSFVFEKESLFFGHSTKPENLKFKSTTNLTGARAGAAVGDYNNDGWEDLLVISEKFLILENKNGSHFEIANIQTGLSEFPWLDDASGAVFLDFDNDGWEDILIVRRGRSHFVLKNSGGRFSIFQEIPNNEDTVMPGLADFNLDGFIDVYLPNRQSPQTVKSIRENPKKAYLEPMLRNENGGRDRILLNQSGKRFFDGSDELGFHSTRYSWAVGLADLNNDRYPDFMIANDFGLDQLFLNEQGKRVHEVSESSFGQIRSRFSMSAEIADVNGDGLSDIYVSNTNSAVLRRGFNSLWINQGGNPPRFTDMARELQVDSCGWSWGSKFVDIDLDGDLDLVVVNGLSQTVNSDFPYWYYLTYNRSIPQQIKKLDLVSINANFGIGMAARQKGCVFLNENGVYTNVSDATGFTDSASKRGLVSLDFDNDGTLDLVVANAGLAASLYKTKIKDKKNWFGIQLVGQNSNRNAIGAKVTYRFNDNLNVREIYPTNGYYAQSSKRLVFAAQNDDKPSIQIQWPSGKRQELKQIALNQYNIVTEEK